MQDVSEIRLRTASVEIGFWLTVVVCLSSFVYVLLTSEQPNRGLITLIFAVALVAAFAIKALPADAIVHSRFREAFFVTWSALDIALIGLVAGLDGGVTSPFASLWFLTLIFAGISYPFASMLAASVLNLLGFGIVAAVAGNPPLDYVWFMLASLAFACGMCAWQAQKHDVQREDLARVSRSDPLTGCLNRRGFEERLAAEVSDSARHGHPFALILLDLDQFKFVNDSHGHAAGDDLLCWVVASTTAVLRPRDAFGRLGGDEFAIVVPGAGERDGVVLADRVRAALAPRISVTTGLACFPADGADRDELYQHADTELYASKHGAASRTAPGRRELSWAAALALAVDARMAVPEEHSSAVARYAASIGQELGWSGSELALLRMAAMLHDVGKVSVPDRILRKPGPLTAEEYEEIKRHPVAGADIVQRVEGLEPIVPWVRHSHEHFDGSGYPDGLSGETIPPASRILLVADAYDAMTSHRAYRRAMSSEDARAELRNHAGTQFDPACVEAFERATGNGQRATRDLDSRA
jgi:diguanylate cyclase (GGDEF)-like protein/putative nucleotidyltransferase with HDIG domain